MKLEWWQVFMLGFFVGVTLGTLYEHHYGYAKHESPCEEEGVK